MLIPPLTEWLTSPETRVLVHYLRRRQAGTLQTFLSGQPVDPLMQGRAAALHELEQLLTQPADYVRKIFETALKEQKAP